MFGTFSKVYSAFKLWSLKCRLSLGRLTCANTEDESFWLVKVFQIFD